MDGTELERRLEQLRASADERPDLPAAMAALVAELPADDPVGPFELGSAYDSTGRPDLAVPLYRRALDLGLAGPRRRRAVVQLASSLRNQGEAVEAVDLLTAELARESDELDDAVRAFLALALADAGREREALSHALTALAPHLPRYARSLAAYARDLRSDARWTLTRTDDNGNTVEMARFADRAAAERARETYERRGHRQLYEVRELRDEPPRAPEPPR